MASSFTTVTCALATTCVIGLGDFAGKAHAQTVIDFNGLPPEVTHNLLIFPYAEDGYTLTSMTFGFAAEINGFQPNGLYLAGSNGSPMVVRLLNADSDPFDLLSIDIGDNSTAGAITFTGSNGASRLIIDSDLGVGVNFAALGGWQNLAWVDITVLSSPTGATGQLTADNLTVQTIPGPSGAVALAAFALVGSGRRRSGRAGLGRSLCPRRDAPLLLVP